MSPKMTDQAVCAARQFRAIVLAVICAVMFALPALAEGSITFRGSTSVPMRSIVLNKQAALLVVGKTAKLKVVSYLPKNATSSKKAKWASSDKSIATVNAKGVVKAKCEGSATIVCTMGGAQAYCVVTVLPRAGYYETEVLRLVNLERTKAGVAPLAFGVVPQRVAALRAKELPLRFSHTRPNGSSCFTAFPSGHRWTARGENIAANYRTPAAVMEAWMGNSSHRNTILNPNYKLLGVAICEKGSKYFWVQVFAAE